MLQVNLIREYHFLVFFCTLLPTWYQVSKMQNTATLEDFLRRETNKTTEENIHLEYTPGANYLCGMFSFFVPCFPPGTRYEKYCTVKYCTSCQ